MQVLELSRNQDDYECLHERKPLRRIDIGPWNQFSVFDDSCTNPKSIALGGDANNSNGTTIVSSNRRLSRSRRSSKSVTICRSNDRKRETIGNFTTERTLNRISVLSNDVTLFTDTLPFEVTEELSNDPRAPYSESFVVSEVSFLVPSSTNRTRRKRLKSALYLKFKKRKVVKRGTLSTF